MRRDLYRVPAHRYDLAGVMKTITGGEVDQAGNYTSGRFQGQNANTVNAIGAGASLAGGMIGGAIGGGMESTAGNIIGGLGDVASMIPGPYGAAIGAGLKVLGGITNAAFGSKINEENVNNVKNNISALNNFKSDVGSFDALSENINSQPTAMRFDKSYIGKDGWFANKAKNLYNDLVKQQTEAEQFAKSSIMNNMNNLITSQAQGLESTFAAHGGPLSTKGADWKSGLNYIGNGGTHEQNPNEGVPMGIAPDGLPNLVEEGEVIWNGDYVFSQRLKVPKSFKEKYKLGKDKPMSYAEAALKFNEEMDEMPNDPIAKRGRDANLSRLAESQEEKRTKIQAREQRQAQAAQLLANAPSASEPMAQSPEEQFAEQSTMEPLTPEQTMEQQVAQGMPMESMYAAKGGPIGHRYDDGGWQLTQRYLDWLNGLSTDEYNALVGSVYDPKKNPKRYAKYTGKDGRQKFFNQANYKSIGNVHRAISGAYAKANPAQLSQPFDDNWFDFNLASQITRYGENNPYGWIDTNPIYTNPEVTTVPSVADARNNAWLRWKNYTGDATVPTGISLATYRPPLSTEPIVESRDANGNPIVTNITPQGDRESLDKALAGRNTAKQDESQSFYDPLSKLRYAPIVGSALGVFSDLMGWTNKPDYSAADALSASTRGLRNVSFTPIGDYAAYRPVDRMNMINQLNANAGATRRNIVNTTGGNRGTAIAGLLAADNAFNNSIGQAYINAENANWDRYMKALAHNASINQFNSQGFLQADTANQRMDEVRARYSALAADARAKALQQASAARSANLTNLFDNLGNLGIDAANRMDTRWLAQFWKGSEKQPTLYKKGGKLNKRRRRII